jgi:hypothetical protein
VVTQALPVHRVRAHNAATASENKIHDDDVARRYGFAGGLVPGITVFGYLTRPVAEAWGREWLEHGTMSGRFRRPIYEGDHVTVRGTILDGRAELEAVITGEEVRAVGAAAVPSPRPEAPSLDSYEVAPLPPVRHPATPEAMGSIGTLGTVEVGFHADRTGATLAELGDDLALYGQLGVAHPAWLLRQANNLLAANVALGPWVHTESELTNYRVLRDGQRLSVRGRVARLFERRGHHLVELDVLFVADSHLAVAHARHTAIYLLAGDGR